MARQTSELAASTEVPEPLPLWVIHRLSVTAFPMVNSPSYKPQRGSPQKAYQGRSKASGTKLLFKEKRKPSLGQQLETLSDNRVSNHISSEKISSKSDCKRGSNQLRPERRDGHPGEQDSAKRLLPLPMRGVTLCSILGSTQHVIICTEEAVHSQGTQQGECIYQPGG
ncbi:hypothetical protein DPX16_5757 [Anabarilius grahami]|uniref:Uncharacterized protein n=1 Tax=Anabarilius grahami TaxID=495550 RepID=A0A3N0Z9Z3_ANAGA|nr:hypothetical protein DPX16_5757 [Anabarilius grahami]